MRQLYFIILLYKEMFRPELIFLQPLKRFFQIIGDSVICHIYGYLKLHVRATRKIKGSQEHSPARISIGTFHLRAVAFSYRSYRSERT